MSKRQAIKIIVLGYVVIIVALYNIIVTFVHMDKQMWIIFIFLAVNLGIWIYTEKIMRGVYRSAFMNKDK